jgi:hypothetical protein
MAALCCQCPCCAVFLHLGRSRLPASASAHVLVLISSRASRAYYLLK